MVSFLENLFLYAIPIFFAIVLHEIAHAAAALLLGDDTAKKQKRFYLHTHFDLFGSFVFPFILYMLQSPFLIGYAKPVFVDIKKFRDPLLDMALVACAGPLTNFLLTAISLMIIKTTSINTMNVSFFGQMLKIFAMTNFGLGLFNLIPIPPLDGSRIFLYILPKSTIMYYRKIERYGIFVILILQIASIHLFKLFGVNGSLFYFLVEAPVNGMSNWCR